MKKTKKYFKNFILFVALIVLTFYIILKDRDVTQIFSILSNVDKKFIVFAVLCMFVYIFCEAINIGRTLKVLNEKSSFFRNVKYALIGFFFSSITPAASGGQPMQIYYMYKDRISIANSTLALLINLACVQIVTITMAFVSLAFNYKYLNDFLIGFFVIGIILNLSALVLWLIFIFSKRMTKGLINFTVKILKLFKIKNIEGKQEKLEKELNVYQNSAKYIKSNKILILKNLLTCYFQYIVYFSISYLVYCSFGLSEHNIFEILTLQSVLYATVSGIPSPGAVGVSEGGYIAIFSAVFPETIINRSNVINKRCEFLFICSN